MLTENTKPEMVGAWQKHVADNQGIIKEADPKTGVIIYNNGSPMHYPV